MIIGETISKQRSSIAAEIARRLADLRAAMRTAGASAFVSQAPATLTYLAGFRALSHTRPIVLVVGETTTGLVAPGLEETHARSRAIVDDLRIYYEDRAVPGHNSHLELVDELVSALPAGGRIGLEMETCPAALAAHFADLGRSTVDVGHLLARMREVKDHFEMVLLAAAADLVNLGVKASVQAAQAGVSEIEIDAAGSAAVLCALVELESPVTLEHHTMTPSGPDRSILPHAFSTTRRLRAGDVLIHTRHVALDGYRAELERTLVLGEPGHEQRTAFEVMRSAQEAAIDAVRPGVSCLEVDRAARRVFNAAGLSAHAIHRTGHGIGLAPHEPPYIRFDETSRLEVGMVITIEPGLYIPGLGGFRHSDTLVVSPDGADLLTSFPSELTALTVPA